MAGIVAYREGDRSFPALWFLRAVGLVLTIITLGLTANSAASFGAIGCSPPSKLSFNLAVTVLSFIVLVYFLLSTGPARPFRILPWIIFAQLALDAFMFVVWLAAGSTSVYNCNDLCSNACGNVLPTLSYGSLACDCNVIVVVKKRDTSPNPARIGVLGKRDIYSDNGGSGAATTAFDAIMTIFFAVCLAATIFWFIQSRQSRTSGSHTYPSAAVPPPPVAGEPIKHEEAGMAAPGAPLYPTAGTPQYPQYQQQQQQQSMQEPTYNHTPATQPQQIYQQPPPHQQQQQKPPMSATGGPMHDPYANTTSTPTGTYSYPPPKGGSVEMAHLGQKTMDGSAAPEVRGHGQTP